MDVKGQTFLITGGSSGLGGATARRLAGAGGNVLIADVKQEEGERLAAELGGAARYCQTDVTDEASVQAAVDAALDAFGALHGVINCAGIVVAGKVLDREGNPHDLGEFNKGIQVNLVGTFNVIRLGVKAMSANTPNAEGERGMIINTASIAAFEGQVGQASYAASKAGVVGMTLPLARELAQHGIRVMTIAPGTFWTPMMEGLPEKVKQSLGEQTPFPPRMGRPEEYARLAQDVIENVFLNGECIRLDGAIRMSGK